MTFPQPHDDELHRAPPDDPWLIETVWFSFMVPNRKMGGTIYLACRPNLNISSLHVFVFDDTAHEPWRVPYWRSLWQLPMPSSINPCHLAEAGLRIEVLESLTTYRIQYEDAPEIGLDLRFEGLRDPHMLCDNHLDQPGHVTGILQLHGERIPIDCFQMRDRTWSTRRSDLEGNRGAYAYAISGSQRGFQILARGEDVSEFAMPERESPSRSSSHNEDDDIQPILGGYLLREGHLCPLVSGRRRVLARGNAAEPLKIELVLTDSEGRVSTAEGTCESRMLLSVNGGMLAWDSLVRWEFDRTVLWGEDQDVWTPRFWRSYSRRTRASGPQ